MERVFTSQAAAAGAFKFIAIALGRPKPGQRHSGLFYKAADADTVLMLHLASDQDLTCEAPISKYLWVIPEIDPLRARQVAVICRNVWETNGRHVPFAFSEPSDWFGPTGQMLLGPEKIGLTCASFVLAVFHAAALPLVRYATWPPGRIEDVEWQRRVIAYFRTVISEERVQSIERTVGATRYRPEEVAAAASTSPLPCSFQDAEAKSQDILDIGQSVWDS